MKHELAAFDAGLAAKPQLVVATKLDVTEARERFATVRDAFAARGVELLGISAVSGEGVRALLVRVADAVRRARADHLPGDERSAPPAEHIELPHP